MEFCSKCAHCERKKVKELRDSGKSYEEIKKIMGYKYDNQVSSRIKSAEKLGV